MPRTYEEHVHNLTALSAQDCPHPGYLSIPSVATMLELRDQLIVDLKRIVEDDARARLRTRRGADL